ncbi:MAG: helix-turn-helix transcriptional regulator [Candidatus Limnocylindrales bacterium]|jgi:transcriptional regulator with XRE-family HTH domain
MAESAAEPILQAFGLAVRNLRRERGLSQEEFADLVGVHRTYMGGIERGERNVSLVNIGKIAESLGLSLGDFMTHVDLALSSSSASRT